MSAEGPRRLAIFGGSFDPPHRGHLHAARAAREAFDLEEVRLLPAARPPHKPGRRLASGVDRVAMLELAFAEQPEPACYVVDRRELEREGLSYTLYSVEEILAEEGGAGAVELFMILGSDNLRGLERWHEVERMLALAQPIVVHRDAELDGLLADLARSLSPEAMQRLHAGLLRLPPVEASSTELRTSFEERRAAGPILTPGVARYIEEHGLYTTGEARG
jgi:nicotinate-nucleotide adenylyltransferase